MSIHDEWISCSRCGDLVVKIAPGPGAPSVWRHTAPGDADHDPIPTTKGPLSIVRAGRRPLGNPAVSYQFGAKDRGDNVIFEGTLVDGQLTMTDLDGQILDDPDLTRRAAAAIVAIWPPTGSMASEG